MKLGMTWGYWGQLPPPDIAGVSQEAERLGFDSVWTAEAWGSDAFTPLAWIAAHTERVRLGHRRRAAGGPHAHRDRHGTP